MNNQYNDSSLLFSSILNLWLSMNEVKIKKSTYDKYAYLIEKHIFPELGNIKMNEINACTVNSFLKNKLTNGSINNQSALSPSYVNTMAVIIKAALDYATNENLFIGLKNPIYKPQKANEEFVILTTNEIIRLNNYLNDHFGGDEMGILLALNMGLRIGEVCALSWDNIDFQNRIIHIKSTITRVKKNGRCVNIIGIPKTNSSIRDIPIPTKIYNYLEKLYNAHNSEYVISDKPTFVYPRTYEYRYHKVMQNAQIRDINFHSLRHTFATHCVVSGMDVKSLSEILGHSNTSITMQRYVHPSMEIKRKQLEKAIY